MISEPAVTTYLIAEPFERALQSVREALARSDLNISAELDVASRIKRELNIVYSPCKVLLVDSSLFLLEAATLDCAAVAMFPLHLVISGRGPQTHIHWINPSAIEGYRLPTGTAVPLAKLQSLVVRALERIAMKRDLQPAYSR